MKKIFFVLAIPFLAYSCSCNSNNGSEVIAGSVPAPAAMNYTVTNVFPHDTSSFTEGFEFHNGFLYESAGNYNESRLVKTDIKTGKNVQRLDLSKEYFGEGISILNGKIYQLTYKEHKCFVYDSATFKTLSELTYEGQGWGMANDGKYLIMDNGGNNLYWRDPQTFKIVKTLGVVDNNGGVAQINELELADGFIYANIWETNYIVKIDTASGHVVAKADLTDLINQYKPEDEETSAQGACLNGIAYDKASKKFYITGKLWNKVFELTFQ